VLNSCTTAGVLTKREKLPPIKRRRVDVKCCMVKAGADFVTVPEEVALEFYDASERFYYMDANSWGNMQKVAAERDGRINEYEQFPCVE